MLLKKCLKACTAAILQLQWATLYFRQPKISAQIFATKHLQFSLSAKTIKAELQALLLKMKAANIFSSTHQKLLLCAPAIMVMILKCWLITFQLQVQSAKFHIQEQTIQATVKRWAFGLARLLMNGLIPQCILIKHLWIIHAKILTHWYANLGLLLMLKANALAMKI